MSIDRRWLVVGLGASLLLNMFLVGLAAGHSFGVHRHRPPPPIFAGPLAPGRHLKEIPIEERKLFNKAMEPHRAMIRASRQEQRRLRAATEADIAAPTFDRDKVDADFKALREGALATQAATQAGLLDALAALSPASRAILVAHENANGEPKGDGQPDPR